ncbi:hypothetical protein [Christiangramia sp. OXR-203]|uniref:hypothetical protein n=1 Tax=Christiangramia sp. OXR-203 TaxID=3100176 RepID=UPI002AC8D136|nr:hypothetical protein [Christiangramia sp. OXR-203]WPY97981.1 hypothetical protein T8I65_12450 [Christiangramia sp. OXR-203]
MKSLAKNLIILTFLSLGTFSCFSQDIQPNVEIYKMIAQIKNSNFSANNLINNSSAVNIQQIGNNNSAIARSYASGIEMSLLQSGDENYIESIVNVEGYKLNASQHGDNNYFSNIPIFSEPGTQLEVIQEGNNQHVENNGANAISKNMSIRIIGDDRMLTIQNIK